MRKLSTIRQIEGFVWRSIVAPFLELEKTIDLSSSGDFGKIMWAKDKTPKVRASFKSISNKYLLKHDG